MSDFPNNVDTFMQASDPETILDINNIKQYQQYLMEGKFDLAQQQLASMLNGVKMSLNAGRFNQVLDAITAIEEFYLGNEGVQNYINDQIKAYSNIEQWNSTTNYNVGNLVAHNGKWYKCTMENQNHEPIYVDAYWGNFLQPQDAKHYPVSKDYPINIQLKDLWFRVID